jgi:hypothetical protein
MATLSEYNAQGGQVSTRRGVLAPNLGAKTPIATEKVEPRKSNIEKFAEWGANIGKTTLNVGSTVGKKTAGYIANTGADIVKKGVLAAKSLTTDPVVQNAKNATISEQQKHLDNIQTGISERYKSGQMGKEDYIKATQELSKAYAELSGESKKISSGPSPADRALAVIETGATLLSVGSLKLGSEGAKQAAKVGVSEFAEQGAKGLERQILRSKAVRSLVERNIQSAARLASSETTEQLMLREGKQIAAGLLIKRPLFYQSNINDARSVLEGVMTGNYTQAVKSAAWIGVQMLDGGPLGAFFKGASWAKGKLANLSYGKDSFIDEVSRQIGNGNTSQIVRFLDTLKEKAPKEYEEAVKTFRIAQEMNLRASSEDVGLASKNFLQTYVDSGIDLANVTPSQLYKDMNNWYKADQAWQSAVRKGLIPGMDKVEAARYTPVRWDSKARNAVADTVRNAETPEDALRAIQKMADQPGNGWGNNDNLYKRIENIIKTSDSGDDAWRRIRGIDAAAVTPSYIPKKIQEEITKLGYTVATPVGGRKIASMDVEDTRKLVTGAIKGVDDAFEETIVPNPGMAAFARGIEELGFSPRSSNQVASKILAENVVANLDNTTAAAIGLNAKGNVPKGGQMILTDLQNYLENKKGIFGLGKASASDLRQLTYKEIMEALPGLRLSRGQAKQLSKAIMQGYLEVPLEFRGAGDKIVDALYRYNPLHKAYSRAQGAFRYTYNPFFRVQERTETAILSRVQANNLVWGQKRAVLDDAVKKLDESRIFTSSLYGEAAQDQVLGRITANITQGQKRDLAGLALDIAKKKGTTIDDLINNHIDEIDDALRVVVQYPRKGILASPLARTMNLAFFPMRYNAKVTMVAAQALAKQPAYIQKAVLHSMFQMGDWLKSPEGIRWQQQHQDAIRLFSWITPINSIAYTMNLLKNGADTPSDLGQLGGLPLGIISQVLDSQGIISLNTPYVDKKSGDVFPKYVPETTKARAAVALTDLLGSTFTYPGRTLGLPGKGEGLRAFVKNFIATEGSDFEKRLDKTKLTDLDRKWIKVIKDMEADKLDDETLDAVYQSAAPGQFNGPTLPPYALPFKTPLPERRTDLPTKSSLKASKKKQKKIAQPIQ